MRQIGIVDYASESQHRIGWIKKLKEFISINSDSNPQTDEEYNSASLQFMTKPHDDIHAAVLDYLKQISAKDYLPGSVHVFFAILKGWLKANRYFIDGIELAEIKSVIPRNVIVTEDEYLTVEKIRSIIAHADSMLRAFVLIACSSGARIGEIMSLDIDSIKYWSEEDVYYFKISYKISKNRKPHTYYLSHEAYHEVTEYLKCRPQYLQLRELYTTKSLKNALAENTDKLFAIDSTSMGRKLTRALDAAGLLAFDKESKRRTIHPHSFRKFADTVFKEHLGVNMGNELIGHDEGLSQSYRRYDPKKVAEAYRKVEPFVTILAPADYVEIKERVSNDVEKIRAALASQSLEMIEIKERLQSTEELLAYTLNFKK